MSNICSVSRPITTYLPMEQSVSAYPAHTVTWSLTMPHVNLLVSKTPMLIVVSTHLQELIFISMDHNLTKTTHIKSISKDFKIPMKIHQALLSVWQVISKVTFTRIKKYVKIKLLHLPSMWRVSESVHYNGDLISTTCTLMQHMSSLSDVLISSEETVSHT